MPRHTPRVHSRRLRLTHLVLDHHPPPSDHPSSPLYLLAAGTLRVLLLSGSVYILLDQLLVRIRIVTVGQLLGLPIIYLRIPLLAHFLPCGVNSKFLLAGLCITNNHVCVSGPPHRRASSSATVSGHCHG